MDNSGVLNAWTKQETLKLIEEYKKHPVLYISQHPEHVIGSKKRAAFLAIVEALKCLKPNVTERHVKTKLKTLRHQLASEKKKIICAKANGMAALAHCKPTLWCFEELSFLLDVNDEQPPTRPIKNFNNLQVQNFNDCQFEEQTGDDSEYFIKPKRVRQDIEVEEFQKTINKSMEIMEKMSATKDTSKEKAFCQYLSTELRAFKLEESFDEFKMSAMNLLQEIKAKEKKIISENNSTWRDFSSSTEPASAPLSFKYRIISPSSSAYSGSAECSRRRSSSAESILAETIRSTSNDFDACDVKCEPEENCE